MRNVSKASAVQTFAPRGQLTYTATSEVASLLREIEAAHRVWVELANTATDSLEAVEDFVTSFGLQGLGMPPDAVAKLTHLVGELAGAVTAEQEAQARKDDATKRLDLHLRHPFPGPSLASAVAGMHDCMGASWPTLPADSLQFQAFEKIRRIGPDAADGATVFHNGVEYGITSDKACTLELTQLTLERLDGAAGGTQSSMAVLRWDRRDTSDVNGLGLLMNALAVGVAMPGQRGLDPAYRVLPVLPVPACYRRVDDTDRVDGISA